jgi:hypothetical protein
MLIVKNKELSAKTVRHLETLPNHDVSFHIRMTPDSAQPMQPALLTSVYLRTTSTRWNLEVEPVPLALASKLLSAPGYTCGNGSTFFPELMDEFFDIEQI